MTGRYRRNPVPLEVRGIARGDEFHGHPLPERADEVSSMRTGFTGYYDAVSYGDPAFSIPTGVHSETGRSRSPSQTSQSWTPSFHDWTTTGGMTDRSSIFSLGEDEFDRKTSMQVHKMFEEIDAILFENVKKGQLHLLSECQDWGENFPHLRILGKQLVSPQDPGYQIIPGTAESYHMFPGATPGLTSTTSGLASTTPGLSSVTPHSDMTSATPSTLRSSATPFTLHSGNFTLQDITEQDISAAHSLNELSISGQHMDASTPSAITFSTQYSEQVPYEEETFAQDGQIEDIIAVDFTSLDEDVKSNLTTRRGTKKHDGIPPMTPQACIRDNLHGATFDFIWTEFISWLRPVHSQFVPEEGGHVSGRADDMMLAGDDDDDDDDEHLTPRQLVSDFGMSPQSREPSFLPLKMIRGPFSFNRENTATTHEGSLDDVLMVSSKVIQSREKSALQDSTDYISTHPSLRPGSSNKYGRPGSVSGHRPDRYPSARMRVAVRHRLAPIDRAKTPSVQSDERTHLQDAILVHRLATPSDHLPGHMVLSRNGTLPPIGLERETSDTSANGTDKKRIVPAPRASSAVHNDKENRSAGLQTYRETSFRERGAPTTQLENRPSTTHAFRSESLTPFGGLSHAAGAIRRSSTPLGFSALRTSLHSGAPGLGNIPQGQPAGGGGGGASGPLASGLSRQMQMSITGSGINPQADGMQDELVEQHYDDLVHSSHWGTTAIHSSVRRTKQQHFNTAVR